jgi:hypothetical protein
MKRLLVLSYITLFLCVSMYFGTGWSLVLFSFPVAPQLTVDNYYLQFVPQIAAAIKFFTWLTVLMIITELIMTAGEWRTRFRWVPIVVLLGTIASTLLETQVIFPLNDAMREGIKDPEQLKDVIGRWMSLNRIRVGVWTVQWAAMAFYVGAQIRPGDPTA